MADQAIRSGGVNRLQIGAAPDKLSGMAAGALVVEGMTVPPRSLVMGSPGKIRRSLTDAEVADIQMYADRYVAYRLDYQ